MRRNLPFCTDHEDTRQREFHKLDAGARVEEGSAQLYAAPSAVPCMSGRTDGVDDEYCGFIYMPPPTRQSAIPYLADRRGWRQGIQSNSAT